MKKGLYILLFAVLIMLSGGCSSEQKLKKEYEALIEETKDDLLPVLDMENGERKKEYDPELLSDDTGAAGRLFFSFCLRLQEFCAGRRILF